MQQIGHFIRDKSGFTGCIQTLTFTLDLALVPAGSSDAENAPDFRVHIGDGDGAEIGAGWKRIGEKAGEFISLVIDDPMLPQPLRANLFQSGADKSAWALNWTRALKRGERD